MDNIAMYRWGMAERKRGRPPSEARGDWVGFLLRMPPDLRAEVQAIADADVFAPSVNTVFLQLIREALDARATPKRR